MITQCPVCKAHENDLIGFDGLMQCKNCESIFGFCTESTKNKLLTGNVSKEPKIDSGCRWVDITFRKGEGIGTVKGWYNFEKDEIVALNVPNGAQNESKTNESTRE